MIWAPLHASVKLIDVASLIINIAEHIRGADKIRVNDGRINTLDASEAAYHVRDGSISGGVMFRRIMAISIGS